MLQSVRELNFIPREKIFPSPADWRDVFVYFLLLDRFDNNDQHLEPFDRTSAPKGRDPRQGKIFQGGNLKGLLRRLDWSMSVCVRMRPSGAKSFPSSF